MESDRADTTVNEVKFAPCRQCGNLRNYGEGVGCPVCGALDAAPAQMTIRPHIVGGEFQSDKYPTCPPGKVPLSVKDPMAQDLLWEYAQRRRRCDVEFSDDLEWALRQAGYTGAVIIHGPES